MKKIAPNNLGLPYKLFIYFKQVFGSTTGFFRYGQPPAFLFIHENVPFCKKRHINLYACIDYTIGKVSSRILTAHKNQFFSKVSIKLETQNRNRYLGIYSNGWWQFKHFLDWERQYLPSNQGQRWSNFHSANKFLTSILVQKITHESRNQSRCKSRYIYLLAT